MTITATAIAAMRQDDNWNLCDIFFMTQPLSSWIILEFTLFTSLTPAVTGTSE